MNTQPAHDASNGAAVTASSLTPASVAAFAFRRAPASAAKPRTAKRPVPQHPELRQNSPNPGKAITDAADGTAVIGQGAALELSFPQFAAITLRRDEPLPLPGPAQLQQTLQPGKPLPATTGNPAMAREETSPLAPKAALNYAPLLRYSGIND